LFEAGGLVVDGGRSALTDAPPIVSRMAFPEDWRIILVLDAARRGIHGEQERAAFRSLPPMTAADAGAICRLALMGALPSIAERDIVGFGAAITRIQQLLGDHFAPAQGGRRFVSPDVEAVMDFLGQQGAHGMGQSSWGPTGFAFAADDREAQRLAESARARSNAGEVEIRVVRALNVGARIDGLPAAAEQRV
jgi:beta-RFAP synthase